MTISNKTTLHHWRPDGKLEFSYWNRKITVEKTRDSRLFHSPVQTESK